MQCIPIADQIKKKKRVAIIFQLAVRDTTLYHSQYFNYMNYPETVLKSSDFLRENSQLFDMNMS